VSPITGLLFTHLSRVEFSEGRIASVRCHIPL
jgi:hypothetical protein